MPELDLSRDIYASFDFSQKNIEIERNIKDDNTVILKFGDMDIIVNDLQALDLLEKLADFFEYKLEDIDIHNLNFKVKERVPDDRS